MNKAKHQSLFILLGTVVLVFLISFTSVKVYFLALDEAKRSHQVQQLAVAKAAADGLNYWLKHFEGEMTMLSTFPALQYLEPDAMKANVDEFFSHINQQGVDNIIVFGRGTEVLYAASAVTPDWMMEDVQSQILDDRSFPQQKNWYSEVKPLNAGNSSQLYFLALKPIIQRYKDSKRSHPNGLMVGCVGYLINFNWLVKQHLVPLRIDETDFAWLMDNSGRLLYHSEHPEMQHRSVKDEAPSCKECHSNFEAQSRILASKAGIQEYQVGAEPRRLMAFAPVDLRNERWVVVMSTLVSRATVLLRTKFRFFFIHTAVIIVIIIISSWLLYFFNTKRIRAEEERRRAEEKEELQEQIGHATKLASIGELVDFVAHEINTPTGIISVHADALLMQNDLDDSVAHDLKLIKAQTARIHKYTRSLLDYSKRMPFHPRDTDIAELVDQCIYLLGHRFRAAKINIIKNYESRIPLIKVDPGQIEQVVINILNNAVDATSRPGDIRISITQKNRNTINGVEISIIDNGEGIREDNKEKIFQAFFTTKQGLKGTGLGLSISRAIVQRHRGSITAASEPGRGAAFTVFLPGDLPEETA